MNKSEIAKRRMAPCGALDGASVCDRVQICQRCHGCLIHCKCCAADARVQPGNGTLSGEQLTLCERPDLCYVGDDPPRRYARSA